MSTETETLTIWALHGHETADTGAKPGASTYQGRREDLPFGAWTSQGWVVERVEQLTVSPEQARALGVEPVIRGVLRSLKARDMLAKFGCTGPSDAVVAGLSTVLRHHPAAYLVQLDDHRGRPVDNRGRDLQGRSVLICLSEAGYIWAVWPASEESTP